MVFLMLDGISVSVRDFWFLVVSGDEEWIQIGPAMEKFPINVILRQHLDLAVSIDLFWVFFMPFSCSGVH